MLACGQMYPRAGSAPGALPVDLPSLLAVLCVPGGGAELELGDHGLLSPEGQLYPFEQPILRMLKQVDPLLAREIDAQAQALPEYLDPRLLMPHYERNFVARLAIEQLLPHGLTHKPDLQALDVGCGVGLLGKLYPDVGWVGLDASLDLLQRVDTGYRLLIEGSAEQLPFKSGSLDLIVAMNMLHHVIDPHRAMSEFARTLKPGGTLIAVDPRKVWLVELGKKLVRSNDAAFAETHRAFSIAEYRALLEAAGAFCIEHFERVGLVGLIGMGGFDATRLSYLLPSAERAVQAFAALDEALFRVPGVHRAGLNLAVRAVRV